MGTGEGYVSPYEKYCQGSRDPDTYFMALNVSTAKVPSSLSHQGSKVLDEIVAFDAAEVSKMHMGQLNLVQVSSFCGPRGLIWGYDAAVARDLRSEQFGKEAGGPEGDTPVYDGTPLIRAATELFGTVIRPRFRIASGSICPAAYRSFKTSGPAVIYAACGIGIRPEGSTGQASLLMEDVGLIPGTQEGEGSWREMIAGNISRSILAVGEAQKISFKEIFVAIDVSNVGAGEVGCALTAAPYFSIASSAIPKGGLDRLKEMDLEEWSESVPRP